MLSSLGFPSTRRTLSLAVAGMLALAACGGSDDSESSPDSGDVVTTESGGGEPASDGGGESDAPADPGDDAPADSGDTGESDIAFLEPAFTIPVDLEPGDGVELAISPDGAYVASVSSQNEMAPVLTLTTYEIATGEQVASVVAAESGTIGSGPTWLADGRIVVRNNDTVAAWTGPDLTPADPVTYDTSAGCDFSFAVDADPGASFHYNEFNEPAIFCRIDLTTGEVTTAPEADADDWFLRAADDTLSYVREGADNDDTLVTLDAATLEEISSEPLDGYRTTNAGLLVGEDADTVLLPGDIPIPTGRLSTGALMSDNGRVLIDGDGFEEIWLSTDDGNPIGQVAPGFAPWQYGWSSDDSVVARPMMSDAGEVAGIGVYTLG